MKFCNKVPYTFVSVAQLFPSSSLSVLDSFSVTSMSSMNFDFSNAGATPVPSSVPSAVSVSMSCTNTTSSGVTQVISNHSTNEQRIPKKEGTSDNELSMSIDASNVTSSVPVSTAGLSSSNVKQGDLKQEITGSNSSGTRSKNNKRKREKQKSFKLASSLYKLRKINRNFLNTEIKCFDPTQEIEWSATIIRIEEVGASNSIRWRLSSSLIGTKEVWVADKVIQTIYKRMTSHQSQGSPLFQGYVDVSTGQLVDCNETFAESKSDDCQVLGSSNKGKL